VGAPVGPKLRFTYADLRELPEDGRRYEVIGGELYVSPAPTTKHQFVLGHVFALLYRAQEAGYGMAWTAPLEVLLDEENAVQPDALFVTRERAAIVREDGVRGVPDLVVEVLSPGTRARDLGVKLRLYMRFGVRTYWAVDPEAETVAVFRPDGSGGYTQTLLGPEEELGCELFPGVTVRVARLFAGAAGRTTP
jgi:Uma2 family endonuclease